MICSGSKEFLDWLFAEIKKIIDAKGGWRRKGNNVYELGFAIRDSLKIAKVIYQDDKPRLTKKYKIVEKYIE